MRILAVTNMYPSAATPRAGTFIEQQVEGLRRLGHEVGVVLIDRAVAGPHRYLSTGRHVRRAVADGNWDVVHVMYGGVFSDLATRALRGLPIVVSFCGTDLLGTEPSSLPMKVRGAMGVFCSRRAARRASAVVVKSKHMIPRLPTSLDRGRISVIPNGVDLGRFRPIDRDWAREQLGWGKERFTVLFSTHTRFDKNKRLTLAEEAVARVNSAGDIAELRTLVDVPHNLVPLWINAADVTLLTSCHEGSPNIVKETLACNRPVVSVDVGDVAERIDGVNGCYLAEPAASALAEALLRVRNHDEPASSGRESMRELSLEAVAEKLVNVYCEAQRTAAAQVQAG